jgi:hypothetical protein
MVTMVDHGHTLTGGETGKTVLQHWNALLDTCMFIIEIYSS